MELGQPDALVLYPRRLKSCGYLVGSLLFVVVGVALLRHRGGEDAVWAWLCIAFFGLGAIVFAVSLLPGANWLRLTADGFVVCSLYRVGKPTPWRDVAAFRPGRMSGNAMVFFDYAPHVERAALARSVAYRLAGAEGALPDTYGMKAAELVALLEKWRSAAVQ